MTLVKDVMTANVTAVPRTATIDVAIDMMVEKNYSGIPVVDDHNHLVGLITEFDVLNLYCTGDAKPEIERCEKYMTRQVKTVQQDTSLEVATRIFQAASLRRLLVLDGDDFVGVLSRRDVVRKIRDQRAAAVGA